MNNKIIIGIAVVLLFGIGGFFLMSKNSGTPSSQLAQPTQEANKLNSLRSLLTSGVAQSCSFSSTNDNSTSEGTVYTTGGKVRGDFTVTVSDKTTKSHMIVDGQTSYIWMDGQKTGFKSSFSATPGAEASPSGSASANGNFNVDANLNYNCKPWVVDNSMFSLPTGIDFMSTETLQQNLNVKTGTGTGSTQPSQCSACNSLSGAEKTQCLTALKCY